MTHCCTNMESFCRTREEWLALMAKMGVDLGRMGEPPEPLVKVERGHYVIRETAIYYCPWCGAKLPTVSPDDLRKDPKRIVVAVDVDGNVTIDGEPVPPGGNEMDIIKRKQAEYMERRADRPRDD